MNDNFIQEIIEHPHKFAWLLGFDKMTEIHSEWIRYLFDSHGHKALRAHRDSYKTTSLIVGIVRYLFIFPNNNILLLRKTESDSKDILRSISRIIESETVQEIFREFYNFNSIKTSLWNSYRIDLSIKTRITADSNVSVLGIGGAITGKHPHLIIADDIITLEDRISRAEREYVKLYVQELINVVRDSCKIIFTGTPWHKDDAWSIIKSITKEIKDYSIYDIDPPVISKEKVDQAKEILSPSMFSCNYELNVNVDDYEKIFGSPVMDNWNIFNYDNIVACLDKSFGGKDLTALSIVGKIKSQEKYVAHVRAWDKPTSEIHSEIINSCLSKKVARIHTERNDDKGNFKTQINFPVFDYQEKENKKIKIDNYLYANWKKIIIDNTSNKLAIEQLTDYSYESEFDDVPDCLANCMRLILKKNIDYSSLYVKN